MTELEAMDSIANSLKELVEVVKASKELERLAIATIEKQGKYISSLEDELSHIYKESKKNENS